MSELDDKELAQLREILSDAESCARLSDWENEFCDDMRGRVLQYGADTRVSDAQWKVIRRIEAKIYA